MLLSLSFSFYYHGSISRLLMMCFSPNLRKGSPEEEKKAFSEDEEIRFTDDADEGFFHLKEDLNYV